MLDIGSSSAQLQVVDVSAGAPPLPAHAVKKPTLPAEELMVNGALSETGIERAAEAVGRAVDAAVRMGVDELYPFVTAAIRDAANRDEVIERIEAESGIRPQFLSGEEEARLTYLAARRWYGWSAGRLLLIDIGGESMELVLGRDAEPELALSLPLGAGRLTREFITADPPTGKQVKAVRRYIQDTLPEVLDRLRWEGRPRRVVATSKTFKQLARLTGAAPQRKGPFVERELRVAKLREWIPRLTEVGAAKRAGFRGISHSRARQVVAGALGAEVTLSALDVKRVEVCPWALREGILLCHLERVAETPSLPLTPLSGHPDAKVRPLHAAEEQTSS
ncbi:hypothetical protein [Amycolatopsis sp. FDAARGOS 1241]|uniref:Ppx/GppA phosphatase family protein n=1 Tax=Amycolatopsis sp. FDAARGOS 1241 TaxID=2778070 RepID=UPI00194F91A8|nr:hypothetical protein [Amycolatopsis sp. FDAARGOS 1241]QRP49737.1 hypothetical protein I6J71_19550 [Amycolatopsis sp. FDAARGOS 1241]